jgi:hypothetical protein
VIERGPARQAGEGSPQEVRVTTGFPSRLPIGPRRETTAVKCRAFPCLPHWGVGGGRRGGGQVKTSTSLELEESTRERRAHTHSGKNTSRPLPLFGPVNDRPTSVLRLRRLNESNLLSAFTEPSGGQGMIDLV